VNTKKQLGKLGEGCCVQYLVGLGYEILQQNFYSPYGEIDIIAKDGHNLVFVEVKTRTKESIDGAKYSITYSKQKKITKTAMYFLKDFIDEDVLEYRFDVMIVKSGTIHHFANAFLPVEVGDFFA